MPQKRSALFERWPRFAARRPWRVLAGAAVVLILSAVLHSAFARSFNDSFGIPGTESQRAITLLSERFERFAGDTALVVVNAPAGIANPSVEARVNELVDELGKLPEVTGVSSPFTAPGSISAGGTTARITVQYGKRAVGLQHSSVQALMTLRQRSSAPGFEVEVGGAVAAVAERPQMGRAEIFGLVAAVIVLLVAFGSVVAMGLPVMTALLALASGLLVVGAGTAFWDIPSFTPEFAAMIGLGVGIDYALLIVTRFREGLARGLSVDDAVVTAQATAGRSVLFAGATVVIAMLGLWAVGIPPIAYVGTAAAVVVALTVAVALLVLPAILSLVGRRVDRWRVPGLPSVSHESETGLGFRLSWAIQRAPVAWLGASLVLMVTLALPVLHMRMGVADQGSDPKSFTSRRAYDLVASGFGPGFNGPVVLAVAINRPAGVAEVEALPGHLRQLPGVALASPPSFNADRTAAVITVIPRSSPQSRETADLVHRLRAVAASRLNPRDADALTAGITAAYIDMGDKISGRMPVFFAAVIGLSFLLLMFVFRSVLVPLKAALMNLLSIAAAYGVLVAVFQWGWLGGVIGVARPGPIESFLPMMLFAVLFGLSMDYEVFLISRIREEYLSSGDTSRSVARGLSLTTRLITAAAAIMVALFLSFALGSERVIKEFGVGLAAAVFLDATVVRLVLVPSLMQLLGDANWWFPSWLDRLLPHIALDQPAGPKPAAGAVPAERE